MKKLTDKEKFEKKVIYYRNKGYLVREIAQKTNRPEGSVKHVINQAKVRETGISGFNGVFNVMNNRLRNRK